MLINQSDFGKIGFTMVLVLAFAFAGGFLIGQQQAYLTCEESKSNDSILLSEERGSATEDFKSTDAIKLSYDVTAQVMTAETSHNTNHVTELNTEPVLSSAIGKEEPEAVVVTNDTAVAQVPPVTDAMTSLSKASLSDSAMLKDQAEIKYTIQVAVYGSLKNAEAMMQKLQSKKLEAYVSDYISKHNHVRYNVRFGYFRDKKSAKKALLDYSDNQQGDGYLVNYSADNIVMFTQEVSADKVPILPGDAV